MVNISFGMTNITKSEGSSFVELMLTKSEGAIGAILVNITTMDGTAGLYALTLCVCVVHYFTTLLAVAGRDYEALKAVVTFEKDDLIAKVPIKIFDNQVVQHTRIFSAVIEITSGLQFPAQVQDSVATVVIEDDDCKLCLTCK